MTRKKHFMVIGLDRTFSAAAAAYHTGLRESTLEVLEPGRALGTVLCIAGWPEPEDAAPDEALLEAWASEGACEATDGCVVEPDGCCEHGHPAWLLALGLV